jgi:ankyrin repeat protein/beta-lactamase regulating signal transducer with metallopeptidase domain
MSETLNTAADQVVHCLLIGSVAALILVPAAWVILKAARIQTPVYRHLIWLDCLIGVVVLPLLWLAGPKLTLTVLPGRVEARAPAVSPPSHDDVGTMAAESSPMVPAETERQSTVGTQPRLAQWQTAVAGLWLAGFAFMLSRLAVGWHHLRHICLSATPISGRQVRHALDGHRLTIRLTRQLQGPVCFGLLRPVILLPEEMYESGTSESLRMILTHELAHLARRDAWINLFQRLVEAAYFFHPFIWFASRQLTQQREQICDNHVLAEGASPTDYSTLLSRIGERALRARHPQTVALFEGHLLARIRSLLDPRGSRQTKLPRRLAALCTVAVLAAFLIFGSVRLAAQPGAGPSSVAQASPSSTKEAGSSAKAATQSMANGESRSAESLHHAARDGDLEQVKTLIARGANVNTVDKDDLTPLYWAALKGHRDVVEFLLRKGANVNCVEQGDLFTPLHGAACNAHLDMVEFLVDKGGYTPLIHVIWNKDKAMTAFLVTHGAKLDLKDKEGFTAWHRAAEQGSRDLLELSAQSAGVSSLPRAAVLGDLARVQRAVEEGAGVNAGDDLGWTPLYWAACTGRTEVARGERQRGVGRRAHP